jgi:exodeoxyribonuclease VII small subunit
MQATGDPDSELPPLDAKLAIGERPAVNKKTPIRESAGIPDPGLFAGTPAGDPGADPVSRFEASLKELEDIVARMERGDLPLEDALRQFERGVALTRECRGSLETAELRVKNVLENADTPLSEAITKPGGQV